jgi:fucose 4-O-acetylase-like acetyltransferase
VVLRGLKDSGSRRITGLVVVLSLTMHFLAGSLPISMKMYIPFGVHIALFVLPLGFAATALSKPTVKNPPWLKWIVLSLFVACVVTGVKAGSSIAIAGGLRVYSLADPGRMLFHDLYVLAAFFTIVLFSKWIKRVPMVQKLGERSLGIFLVHSFVWQVAVRGLRLGAEEGAPFVRVFLVAVSWISVLLISWSVIRVLDFFPFLRKAIFPGNYREWNISSRFHAVSG